MRGALSSQFGLLLVLALAAALNVVGIGFGMPRHYDPSVDSIHPALSLDAFDRVAGNRHVGGLKYPRTHLVVVGALQRGWLVMRHGEEGAAAGDAIVTRLRSLAPKSSIEARDAFREFASYLTELVIVGRLASAAFGVLLVFAMFRLGRLFGGASAGSIAAFLTAVSFPVVYYAHTLNVDVPMFALSFYGFAELLYAARERCGRRLVASAVLIALAVGVKDQAYALFAGAVPLAAYHWFRRDLDRTPERGSLRAPIAACVVAVLVYALSQGLPFDSAGVRAHFEHIVGAGSETYRIYPKDLGGQWLLLRETASHLLATMGWPLAVLAIVGVALTWRRDRFAALALLVPALTVHFTFQAVIGYTYLRFTLPIALLGLLAVALVFAEFLRAQSLRIPALLVLLLLAADRAQRAIEVDQMLVEDSQAAASDWLAKNIAPGETVFAALELPLHNVDIPPAAATRNFDPTTKPELKAGELAPQTIVFSVYDPMLTAYEPNPPFADTPDRTTIFGYEYRAVASFAPSLRHPIRQGAAFCPTVVVFRRVVEGR